MIYLLYFASVVLAFLYIFIIIHLWTAWQEISDWEPSPGFKPETSVSVIIPCRNEEENIGQCCLSILRTAYPKSKLELIAVDDHSTDGTVEEIPAGVKVVKNEGEGKKKAISTGIAAASGDLIITVDADCTVGREWLIHIVSYYEYTRKRLVVGMVSLDGRKNVLEYFQIMDTCGVMGLHAAGIHNKTHFLANGANFIFEKSLFQEIMPYDDNHELASGDDVFFVNKVGEESPAVIGFLKSTQSVVTSMAERTWSELYTQRKRWATKTSRFSTGIYKWMTGSIWLLCASIILNFILIPFTAGLSLFVAITQLFIKGAMDFLYLQNMCKYFEKSKTLKYFIPSLFIHTFYVFIAGVLTFTKGQYEWKGRKVR